MCYSSPQTLVLPTQLALKEETAVPLAHLPDTHCSSPKPLPFTTVRKESGCILSPGSTTFAPDQHSGPKLQEHLATASVWWHATEQLWSRASADSRTLFVRLPYQLLINKKVPVIIQQPSLWLPRTTLERADICTQLYEGVSLWYLDIQQPAVAEGTIDI